MRTTRFWTIVFCGAALACLPAAFAQDDKPKEGDKPAAKEGDKPDKAKAEKTPKQIFAELDKNDDGELTKDELSEDQQRFFERLLRAADKDKDGKLTSAEFTEGVKPDELRPAADGGRPGDRPDRQFNPEEMFNRFDANKDGKLTLSEAPERGREMLTRMFERAGKGKDDELTKEEFLKIAKDFRPDARPGQGQGFFGNAEEMFKRLDANGDGKLTLSEVPERGKDIAERIFKAAGKEKDGELTKDEFVKVAREVRPFEGRPGQPPAPGLVPGPLGNPEELFKLLDADGDGKLTLKEAPERNRELAERVFKQAGKGKDDELTKEEFLKSLRDFRPELRSPEDERRRMMAAAGMENRVKGWDKNDDGKVALDEAPAENRAQLEQMIRSIGKDPKDGLLLADLPKVLTARTANPLVPVPPMPFGAFPGFAPGSLLRRLDANNDGRISREEMEKAVDVFEELDENKDGELDPRELFSSASDAIRPPDAPRVPIPGFIDPLKPVDPTKPGAPKPPEPPRPDAPPPKVDVPKPATPKPDKPKTDAPKPETPAAGDKKDTKKDDKKPEEKREDRREGERKKETPEKK